MDRVYKALLGRSFDVMPSRQKFQLWAISQYNQNAAGIAAQQSKTNLFFIGQIPA